MEEIEQQTGICSPKERNKNNLEETGHVYSWDQNKRLGQEAEREESLKLSCENSWDWNQWLYAMQYGGKTE